MSIKIVKQLNSYQLLLSQGPYLIIITTKNILFMKMLGITSKLLLVVAIAFIGFTACQKENSTTTTNVDETTFANATSESDAEAEVVFEDVFDNVMGTSDEVGMSGVGILGSVNNNNNGFDLNGADSLGTRCFTVTITKLNPPNAFPVKIVVDFGTGCTGRDGRTRKGKIITEYTNRLVVPGAKATTIFDGYYVNDIKVEGTHIIENKSTQNALIFRNQVIGGKLTKPNGNFTEWSKDKTWEQVEGFGTPFFPLDDVFKITGQANGAVKIGTNFMQWSHIITKPLYRKFTCRYTVKGEVTIQRTNKPVAVLDYGTGNCDNKATITVNGVTREITL